MTKVRSTARLNIIPTRANVAGKTGPKNCGEVGISGRVWQGESDERKLPAFPLGKKNSQTATTSGGPKIRKGFATNNGLEGER